MKYIIELRSEEGNTYIRELETSSDSQEKNLNDFILDALRISEDKRKLPLKIQCPNGLEVYPKLKMKFKNFGNPLLEDELESLHITW